MEAHEGTQKFQQAEAFFVSGNYAEALALLDSLRQSYPEKKKVVHATALCLEQLGRLDEAKQYASQLIAQSPDPKYVALRERLDSRTPTPSDKPSAVPPPLPRRPIRRSAKQSDSKGVLIGILCAVLIGLVLFGSILAAIMLPALARAREAARRASCQNNLKQWGLVYKMYANESPGNLWPSTWSSGSHLTPNPVVCPEYLSDSSIAFCPSDDEAPPISMDPEADFAQSSYFYFGHAFSSEVELLAFLNAYPDFLRHELDFSGNMPASSGQGSFGSNQFIRLTDGNLGGGIKGLEGLPLSARMQAQLPVMMDRIAVDPSTGSLTFSHYQDGCNVLYMDGHVEFIEYPGDFPLTPAVVEALSELQLNTFNPDDAPVSAQSSGSGHAPPIKTARHVSSIQEPPKKAIAKTTTQKPTATTKPPIKKPIVATQTQEVESIVVRNPPKKKGALRTSSTTRYMKKNWCQTRHEINPVGLDLVRDLCRFIGCDFDRNKKRYIKGGREIFVGNGLPDAAEFYLLQRVLAQPDLSFARHSGVTHEGVQKVWEENLERAKTDLAGLEDYQIRVFAAYFTVGDFDSAEWAVELLRQTDPAITIDARSYNNSRGRYLSIDNDADNDAFSNFDEWEALQTGDFTADLHQYGKAALDRDINLWEKRRKP
jgi:prepilin-type processing-associated H-X9-DG protein